MKNALKITGKIILWFFGIIIGLIIISTATHNIQNSIEKNKYKMGQSIKVDGKKMNAYVTGSGEKTIVLLSGLGTASPIADDGMNQNNYYSAELVNLKNKATLWNSLNVCIINEMNAVNSNTKELYDEKYPNDLPVLAFLSKDAVDTEPDWLPLHEEVISNADIQKIVPLSGGHYLHWTNADKIAEMTKEFISTQLK